MGVSLHWINSQRTSEHGQSNSSLHGAWRFWGPGCFLCEGPATPFVPLRFSLSWPGCSSLSYIGLQKMCQPLLLVGSLGRNLLWVFLQLCWARTRDILLGVGAKALSKNQSLCSLLCLKGGWWNPSQEQAFVDLGPGQCLLNCFPFGQGSESLLCPLSSLQCCQCRPSKVNTITNRAES